MKWVVCNAVSNANDHGYFVGCIGLSWNGSNTLDPYDQLCRIDTVVSRCCYVVVCCANLSCRITAGLYFSAHWCPPCHVESLQDSTSRRTGARHVADSRRSWPSTTNRWRRKSETSLRSFSSAPTAARTNGENTSEKCLGWHFHSLLENQRCSWALE